MTPPKTVFMVWRPWIGALQTAIAERLHNRGFALHLYAPKQSDVADLASRPSARFFKTIKVFQILYEIARAPVDDEQHEIGRARAHEKAYDLTFTSLCVGDHHLGRGFAVGAPKFPKSSQSQASRAQTLAAVSAQLEFWEREFNEYRPDIMLDGNQFNEAVANRRNVPIRFLAASRHQNFHYWAHNNFYETPAFVTSYQALKATPFAAPRSEIEQAYAVVKYWQGAMEMTKLHRLVYSAAYAIARRIYDRLKGREPKSYYLSEELLFLWRKRRQVAAMTGPDMIPLSQLAGKRFVFFPLATEPEVTLQGLSPEYFFQLESIAALSRDLPADVLLAVKEHHPACGARSSTFYSQIRSFKNVVMLDMRENGPAVIKAAEVTVTIAGSAGFEAAAMGKPTIIFGRHNIFDFLPHVRLVADIAKLRAALTDALEGRLAGPEATADGLRFLKAVETCSFDLEKFNPYASKPGVSHPSADAALKALFESLGDDLLANATANRLASQPHSGAISNAVERVTTIAYPPSRSQA